MMLTSIWGFICETVEGQWRLHFRRTPPKYRPLPDYVRRLEIAGPGGTLELLFCEPENFEPTSKPVLFQHGGFGHASVWLEWMGYLHHHYGGRTYALSLRGHGASYQPSSWFSMVWLTKFDHLANELLGAIATVKDREGINPVLVAHSAGGAISQYVLAKGWVHLPALGLIGHVPHYGITPVFTNWGNFDRSMYLRGFFHFQHPKSTLSTTRLTRNAFFGPDFTIEQTKEFEKWSADYESMWWPLGCLGTTKNGQATWLEAQDIVRSIETNTGGDRVLILVGSEDMLMKGTSDRCVAEYRSALKQVNDKSEVRFVEIERAGHHVQNDAQRDQAAEALTAWLRQV